MKPTLTRDPQLRTRPEARVEIRRRRPRWWVPAGIVAVLAALAIGLATVETGPTPIGPQAEAPADEHQAMRQAFDELQSGMTLAAANAAMGGPGEEISWRELGDDRIETYYWMDGQGATVTATFHNGVLVQRAQLGLY